MDTLFLAWQDPTERRWHPVGRLDRTNGTYTFVYTKGAAEARDQGFTPIVSFPDFDARYEADEIFPLFANRVLSPNRPEYNDFVEWLSIPKHEADPIAILARTGSDRQADTLEIFPLPQREGDAYHVHFFLRGLRHQAPNAIDRVKSLEIGERLCMMADFQNEHDPDAIALRTDEQHEQDLHLLGYLPRYLASELKCVERENLEEAVVTVERVNPPPAPVHFRVLCSMTMRWLSDFQPFSMEEYQPLVDG